MDSLDLAIYKTAHEDLPSLAKKMGINEQSLRNKVNPSNDLAKLSVQELRSMMLLTANSRVLEVLADDLDFKVEPKTQLNNLPVLHALLLVGKEQGDVSNKLLVALSDGIITPRECAEIENEISEAINSLSALQKSMKSQVGKKIIIQ